MNKVLVIGDTILDKYIYLETLKISDEAPVITHNIKNIKFVLGGGANVARNIIALGSKCSYIGLEDSKETFIESLFNEYNIEHILINKQHSVPIKTRIISRNQQICRFDTKNEIILNNSDVDFFKKYIDENIHKFDCVVFSKYFDGFLNKELVNYISSKCRNMNIFTILDNRQSNSHEYKNIDLLKLNLNEFSNLIPKKINLKNEKEIYDELKILYKNLDYKIIVVTRAEQDVVAIWNNKIFIYPVKKEEVIDVSGAGDTFVATIASFWNGDIDYSIQLAIRSSKISIGKLGTAVTYKRELFPNDNNLKDLIWSLKKENKKIVFTNGVFDILHSGHIKLLSESKKYGDFLIVGLNSDLSTKKIKGNRRPINNENDRKELLLSLKTVDYVQIFDETTVSRLLEIIEPDYYIKGGDYDINSLPESNSIPNNTKVVFVNYKDGYSTTKIIEKINK